MNGNTKPYHCKGCGKVLCLVSGKVLQFPLIYNYVPTIEIKGKYLPLKCPCGFENKIQVEK